MRRKKKPTVTLSVRVRPEVADALDQWAEENSQYLNAAVEQLLEAGIEAIRINQNGAQQK